jgi:hypothetical protein
MRVVISTERHIEYAMGYIGLGRLDDAANELEKISFDDRLLPAVLMVRAELYAEAKQWDMVVNMAKEVSFLKNDVEQAWIM